MGGGRELEPGDVARAVAGGAPDGLADYGAAVHGFPARAGIVAADSLALEDQCRDRFAETPRELAILVCRTFVELRALRVQGNDLGLAWCRDLRWQLRLG